MCSCRHFEGPEKIGLCENVELSPFSSDLRPRSRVLRAAVAECVFLPRMTWGAKM